MPFYEYQCTECEHRLEALQKMSDDPLVYCPECDAASLKKLISAAAFHLKGTGWYETDFKNNEKSKDESASDKKQDDSAAGKGDADKSATKADKPSDSSTPKAPESNKPAKTASSATSKKDSGSQKTASAST